MSSRHPFAKASLMVACLSVGLAGQVSAATVWGENFSSVTTGTDLATVAGWSLSSGAASAIQPFSGYGQGILQPDGGNGKYVRNLSGGEVATGTGASFSFVCQVSTDKGYLMSYELGKAGSDNAFVFQVDGGPHGDSGGWDNGRDNAFHVSSGGANQAGATFTTISSNGDYSSTWAAGAAYQIEITNINLAGAGNTVTATFTVTDLATNTALYTTPITATGADAGNAFDKIDYFSFARSQPAGSYYWDDHGATSMTNFNLSAAVPEPTSMVLLGLGGLSLLARRRRIA